MSVDQALPPGHFDSPAQQGDAVTLGMWIFLATELMFFGPLLLGYSFGRARFAEAFFAASRHTDIVAGTVNTALLLTSSLLMACAVEARNCGRTREAKRLLWLVGAFGIAFVLIKAGEYRREWQEHLFPGAGFAFPGQYGGPARMFFFLYFAMTALHALHLLIGVGVVCLFAASLQTGREGFASAQRIEVTGLYWHFVDIVWIFLYPMLYLAGRSG
jgi:cytochrome c oxidase subunit III